MGSSSSPVIEFPYYPHIPKNTEKCTVDNFFHWNEIQEWSWTQDVSLSASAAFLQSWLFFGLVSIFVGRNVLHQELLEENEDGHDILSFIGTESKLALLLNQVAPTYANGKNSDRVPENQRLVQFALYHAVNVLEIAQDYLNATEDGSARDLWTSEAHKVIFGIDILIDILCDHVTQYQTQSEFLYWRLTNRRSLATENAVIRRSIWRTGRCHSLARRLQASASTWYKILLLPVLPVAQTHTNCLEYDCSHNSTASSKRTLKCKSKGQTKPKSKSAAKRNILHAATCPGCKHVYVNPEEIANIIDEGRTPLVEVTFDVEKQPSIKLVRGDLKHRYTAISHVWAGGLGSEDINSLSSCQILRLWHMVQELPDLRPMDVERVGLKGSDNRRQKFAKIMDLTWNRLRSQEKLYLWLDVLCVPVGAAFQDRRTKAIDCMSQIYAGAESVLVLDPHLQLLEEYESPDSLELHLSISPWMARSWPLQEGALASNLCVRLKNETVILTRSQQKLLLSLSLHLTNSVSESRVRQNPEFHTVWNALASRNTTESRDLSAIFAALLNLSAGKVLSIKSADQMKAIIARQKVIPFAIMCCSCAQTQGEAGGSTWIPLLPQSSPQTGILNSFYGLLKISDGGLRFEKSAQSRTFGMAATTQIDLNARLSLREIARDEYYNIGWDCRTTTHQRPFTTLRLLFMMTFQPSSASLRYRGCCFEIVQQTDSGVELKFVHSLTWSFTNASAVEALPTEASRFDQLDMPDYDIVVVENIKTWPKLDWFRLERFPFIGISDFQEDYSLSKTFAAALLTTLAGGVNIVRLVLMEDVFEVYPIYNSHMDGRWKTLNYTDLALSGVNFTALLETPWSQMLPTLIALNASHGNLSPFIEEFKLEPSEVRKPVTILLSGFLIWFMVRFVYFELETIFWKMWLARLVQQQWAATFVDNSESAEKLLNDSEPTRYFHIFTHIPLFIIASMLIIWAAFVGSTSHRDIIFSMAAILILEPAVGLLISRMINNMQDIIRRRGQADPLPLKWSIVTFLIVPGVAYAFWEMRILLWSVDITDTKVDMAFYAAVYAFVVAVVGVAWLSGILSYTIWLWQHRREPRQTSPGSGNLSSTASKALATNTGKETQMKKQKITHTRRTRSKKKRRSRR